MMHIYYTWKEKSEGRTPNHGVAFWMHKHLQKCGTIFDSIVEKVVCRPKTKQKTLTKYHSSVHSNQ